ncbi:MAG: SDR family oxidoreductase [Candidatus Verstraetearchaeota archaeon]|nr:SDR family oxidoreductase [Candidatus Verstraetearchaeota archaeon]
MGSKIDDLVPLEELISLREKTALITGSATGIGKAIARRFAEAGANLELVDINEKGLDEVKGELESYCVRVNIHIVDLSKKAQIDSLWEGLSGKEPDILVNNAGIYPSKSFLDVDEVFLDKVMGVNLESVFWMCQQMIRRRLKKGGIIINMGSIEAVMPLKEGLSHYDASKAGVMVLSRALASEYGKHGFRINVLVPGGIWTSGTKSLALEAIKLNMNVVKSGIEYDMRTPLRRLGKPDEVARMALVLASDLSSYVNGALIVVDGGFLSA